jgi:hypothetical protein
LRLSALGDKQVLSYVQVVPHMVDHIDGTPVTIFAGTSYDI